MLRAHLVFAAALLLLAGCGAHVLDRTGTAHATGQQWLVIVESTAAMPPGHLGSSAGAEAAREMEDLVVADLNKRGVLAVKAGAEEAKRYYGASGTALLELSITDLDQGNAAKRLIVGFGYGKSELEVKARLLAPADAEEHLIVGFRTEAGSGYKPGVVMPLGVGVATGGYVIATTGINLATGVMRTPHHDIDATAKAIGKTVAEAMKPSNR